MLKQKFCFITLCALIMALAGCNAGPLQHKPTARLPSRHQVCTKLKHQIIFKNNPIGPLSPNNYNQQNLPITQARLMNEYQRYNCDAIE